MSEAGPSNTKYEKFQHVRITAQGEDRASIEPTGLDTLWINTGTLCNLECANCYIESSPKNDRLVYITADEVKDYLEEIKSENLGTKEIAFTGGEPFMNKEMISILRLCLEFGFETLVLTNAMKPMHKRENELLNLKNEFGDKLKIRVSIDHYTEEKHAEERGPKAWDPAIEGLQWLSENEFNFSVAGRTLWGEKESDMRVAYGEMFTEKGIHLNPHDKESLMLFPEMDEKAEVPEITTKCWDILGIAPESIMCANSRMVVKRKGESRPKVLACTLLAYDKRFEMGTSLKESLRPIYLNHPHCSKFCVLGGGSCTA